MSSPIFVKKDILVGPPEARVCGRVKCRKRKESGVVFPDFPDSDVV
jgi:hypothetical protein